MRAHLAIQAVMTNLNGNDVKGNSASFAPQTKHAWLWLQRGGGKRGVGVRVSRQQQARAGNGAHRLHSPDDSTRAKKHKSSKRQNVGVSGVKPVW